MVHTRGRQCVCNYSGFSKRIPRPEHPRVGYTFPIKLRKVIPQGKSLHGPRIAVLFIKLIFDTHRSPHIGSKLCFVRAPRGVGYWPGVWLG